MSDPHLRKIHVNGVELAYFERNQPQPGEPTLLLVHATGFHGRIWDRVLEPFGDRHSIALEQRGHGRSEKRKIEHWQVVGKDVAAFVETLELTNLIGIGHSMGAHALVDAAATIGAFARLLLLDPTIPDPEAFTNPTLAFDLPDGMHPAARRYNAFTSVDDMMERLAPKSAFPLYDPQDLQGLLRAWPGRLRQRRHDPRLPAGNRGIGVHGVQIQLPPSSTAWRRWTCRCWWCVPRPPKPSAASWTSPPRPPGRAWRHAFPKAGNCTGPT